MKKNLILSFLCLLAMNVFGQNSIMDFYDAKVKEIQTSISDASKKPIIKFKDENNGFISYNLTTVTIMGFEEMAYFYSNDGKKFVATITFGCGPLCGCGYPVFYELKKGKLVNQTEKYLPKAIQESIESYYQQEEAKLKSKFGKDTIPFSFWVKLPRVGTTIQIGLMEGGMENGKFYLISELQYNATNGTFQFVKK